MSDRDHPGRVGLLAPMPSEFQPLAKALSLQRTNSGWTGAHGPIALVAATTGIGTRLAAAAAERLLDTGGVEHVMVVGIAGGLGPSKVGDVIVPAVVVDKASGAEYRPTPLGRIEPSGRLVTHDDFDMRPSERDALVAAGFVAVDMETATVARVCADRGVPWSAVRSISDLVGVTPGDVIGLANADGTPNVGASIRYLITKPWRVPGSFGSVSMPAARPGARLRPRRGRCTRRAGPPVERRPRVCDYCCRRVMSSEKLWGEVSAPVRVAASTCTVPHVPGDRHAALNTVTSAEMMVVLAAVLAPTAQVERVSPYGPIE